MKTTCLIIYKTRSYPNGVDDNLYIFFVSLNISSLQVSGQTFGEEGPGSYDASFGTSPVQIRPTVTELWPEICLKVTSINR